MTKQEFESIKENYREQMRDLIANPPNHVPADRLEEFRELVNQALSAVDAPSQADERLIGLNSNWIWAKMDLDARTVAIVKKAMACGVYERRAPSSLAEVALDIALTPSDQPHMQERLYPVVQR